MKKKAFSTLEALMAILLVGMAIVALMGANAAFTRANGAGAKLSTAEFLGEQIRELTEMTGYDQLANLDERTFNPPIDADQDELGHFSDYSQYVIVQNVMANDFTDVVADGTTDFVRVTVTVSHNNEPVSSTSWIRARY